MTYTKPEPTTTLNQDDAEWQKAITVKYSDGHVKPLLPVPIFEALIQHGAAEQDIFYYFSGRDSAVHIEHPIMFKECDGSLDFIRSVPVTQWLDGVNVLAATTVEDGRVNIEPVDALPEWLRRTLNQVGPSVRANVETPEPGYFFAASPDLDWFAMADEHPDDLKVWNPWETPAAYPDIASAWEAAKEEDVSGFLDVSLVPGDVRGTCTADLMGMLLHDPPQDLVRTVTGLIGEPVPKENFVYADPSSKDVEWRWC